MCPLHQSLGRLCEGEGGWLLATLSQPCGAGVARDFIPADVVLFNSLIKLSHPISPYSDPLTVTKSS